MAPGAIINTTQGSQTIITEYNGIVHFQPAKAICHLNRKRKTFIIRRGLQRILSNAFRYSSLVYLTIPASIIVIGKYSFAECFNLIYIKFSIDSRLQIIDEYAFYKCKKLGCMCLPSSLRELRSFAFAECEKLCSVIFAENSCLEKLGDSCFDCTRITNLSLPSSIKEINGNVCGKVQHISSFSIDENPNFRIKEKLLLTGDNKEVVSILPNGLKLEFPMSVKIIRTNSIANCLFFQIDIPIYIEEIKDFAFCANEMLTKVTFSDGSRLQHIGKGLFKGSKIKSLSLPESVESIDIDAFVGLQLDSLEINNSKYVTDYEGVVHGMDPPGIVFVPKNIDKITLNPKLRVIYGNCFRMSKINTIIIPVNVKTIGTNAFASPYIEKIKFKPDVKLEYIGKNAFYCSNLVELELPISIDTIEDYAFGEYPITIPRGFKLTNHTQADLFHGNTIRVHIQSLKEISSLQFKNCQIEIDEEVSQNSTHSMH